MTATSTNDFEVSEHVVPARHWQRLADGRFECRVCPRFCRIKPGQRGLCFVRAAGADGMVLTSYGRSSGFCIDPIEKKPLNHFLPGTPVLSFGTAGCNLVCKFCQNWDISKSRETDILADTATPDMLARAAAHYGCRAVAYTYNDPVIFLEYAVDTAAACRAAGIRNVAVTNGYICPEAGAEFFAAMDAANVDLKAFSERFYHQITGSHLQPVLDTIVYLARETGVWLELTTLVIPGENDSSAEIERMCTWIMDNVGPDVPLHFTAFHPDFRMLETPATPHATLTRAREIARKAGLHHVYVGNVHDRRGSSTYCPGCGEMVIGRDWYVLSRWHLDAGGACGSCGQRIAGVFEAAPGDWGARRVPVRMSAFRPAA